MFVTMVGIRCLNASHLLFISSGVIYIRKLYRISFIFPFCSLFAQSMLMQQIVWLEQCAYFLVLCCWDAASLQWPLCVTSSYMWHDVDCRLKSSINFYLSAVDIVNILIFSLAAANLLVEPCISFGQGRSVVFFILILCRRNLTNYIWWPGSHWMRLSFAVRARWMVMVLLFVFFNPILSCQIFYYFWIQIHKTFWYRLSDFFGSGVWWRNLFLVLLRLIEPLILMGIIDLVIFDC